MPHKVDEISIDDFDLFNISDAVYEMQKAAEEREGRALEIDTQMAVLRADRQTERHDFEIIDLRETETICAMARRLRQKYPRAPMHLTLEIKDEFAQAPKRKTPVTADSDGPSSSSPGQSAKKQTKRTAELAAYAQARLASIQDVMDFERQLGDWWRCHNDSCANCGNFCFIFGAGADKQHFNISVLHQSIWAAICARQKTTTHHPPTNILAYWLNQ